MPSTAQHVSIGSVLPEAKNMFLAAVGRGPGFACEMEGLDLWAFQKSLKLIERHCEPGNVIKRCAAVFLHASGLRAEVEYRGFADTRAVEIAGRITNAGRRSVRRMRGPFSLACQLAASDLGVLRVGLMEGGGSIDGCYPPSAYRWREVDLFDAGNLSLVGGREGGRSTEDAMPYLFVLSPKKKQGMFLALEWPCRWMIGLRMEPCFLGPRTLSLWAHPAGVRFDMRRGDSVVIPRVVLGFFEGDFLDGSNALRRHIVRHVRRPVQGQVGSLPPVFHNTWYELGNHFTMAILKREADLHAALGVEYFVLDAGWFEGGFRAGIGNWEKVDRHKLPDDLSGLARYVESKGMKFGSWLEIEFAMRHSDWGKRHRQWFYDAGERQNQAQAIQRYADLLLKLDDAEVRARVADFLEAWVRQHRIQWLRWDFNNAPGPFWETHEAAGQMGRRQLGYGEGLYALLDDFTARCPHVHVETCAGGGHRMDLGMIRRAHSAWMNDNTLSYHAVRRMQSGINRVLPGCYANSCFHWATPAARGNRRVAAKVRREGYARAIIRSRMAGSLGFAEDSRLWSPRTRQYLAEEIRRYKSVRRFLMEDYYPLFSPGSIRDYDGWQFHDPQRQEGFFMVFRCESPRRRVEVGLRGLEQGQSYVARDLDTGETVKIHPGQPVRLEAPQTNGTHWMSYRVNA